MKGYEANNISYLPIASYEKYKKHQLRVNDLVVSTVGSHPTQPGSVVGRTAVIPKHFDGAFLNQNAVCIRVKRLDLISPKFLICISKTIVFKHHIESRARGSANQVRMALGELKKFKFGFPPLPIQKKIAAVLSAYDDLIENNDRRIALLEKMAEEIYREWFVRLRFPGHDQSTFHKGIPEGWEVVNLEKVCHSITDGKHGDCRDELSSGYYFISAKDINNGRINYENAREIAKTDFEETHRRTNLSPNDILITNSGTIGRLAIAPNSEKTFRTTFQKSVAIVKPNIELASTYFLYQTFLDKNTILSDFAGGTAQKNLLLGDLRRFKILLPPSRIQQLFNKISLPIFNQVESLRETNHILRITRDRLLTRLISGKLSVEDIDIQFPPSMTDLQ